MILYSILLLLLILPILWWWSVKFDKFELGRHFAKLLFWYTGTGLLFVLLWLFD